MLTHPTLDQLKALNLDGMADAFVELQNRAQAAELSHAEWLALLLDRWFACAEVYQHAEPRFAWKSFYRKFQLLLRKVFDEC